ncbi:MAG TPA: hypothetical protein VFX39_01965 [Gemmatimonadaceae bacterium]|nr:hypothetical protein [Gemmatimonadaceae bacterium]
MAMHGPSRHTPGYTPFKKTGWGAAAFISALAIGCFLTAFAIHKATYNDPIDPLSPYKGRPVAEHAEQPPLAPASDATVPAAGADHSGSH